MGSDRIIGNEPTASYFSYQWWCQLESQILQAMQRWRSKSQDQKSIWPQQTHIFFSAMLLTFWRQLGTVSVILTDSPTRSKCTTIIIIIIVTVYYWNTTPNQFRKTGIPSHGNILKCSILWKWIAQLPGLGFVTNSQVPCMVISLCKDESQSSGSSKLNGAYTCFCYNNSYACTYVYITGTQWDSCFSSSGLNP